MEKTKNIDYSNLICVDCKKNKAELIRGTKDYLCVDCFKKWVNKDKGEKHEDKQTKI